MDNDDDDQYLDIIIKEDETEPDYPKHVFKRVGPPSYHNKPVDCCNCWDVLWPGDELYIQKEEEIYQPYCPECVYDHEFEEGFNIIE